MSRPDYTLAVSDAINASSGYTAGFLAQLNFDSGVSSSSLSWIVDSVGDPRLVTVLMECSINDGGSWIPVLRSGDPISVLEVGKAYAGKDLLIRQSFAYPPGHEPPRLRQVVTHIEWDSGSTEYTRIEGQGGIAFKAPGDAGYDPEVNGSYLGATVESAKVVALATPVLEFTPSRWVYANVPEQDRTQTIELLRVSIADPTADANMHPLCSFHRAPFEGEEFAEWDMPGCWIGYKGNDLYCAFAGYARVGWIGLGSQIVIAQHTNILKIPGAVIAGIPFDVALTHAWVPLKDLSDSEPIKDTRVGVNQTVYVNGLPVARATEGYMAMMGFGHFMLGTHHYSRGDTLRAGDRIGEVRLWSESLSGADVARRRRRRLTTSEKALDTLKLLWEFDEGAGNTLTDASTHSTNGTIYSTDGDPWRIVRGLIGRRDGPYEITPYRISPPLSLDIEGTNVLRAATTPRGMDVLWNGKTFLGLGEFGNVSEAHDSSELESPGLQFTLSGVNAAHIALPLTEHFLDRRCFLWLIWWNTTTGAMVVDPLLVFKGRMDDIAILMDAGNLVVTVRAENELVNWQRQTIRRWNDADQRGWFPADAGLALLARTTRQTIYWPSQLVDFEPGEE